jgi:hypothetical protein
MLVGIVTTSLIPHVTNLLVSAFESYLIAYAVFVEATLVQPTVLIVTLAPSVCAVTPNLQVSTNILIPTPVFAPISVLPTDELTVIF